MLKDDSAGLPLRSSRLFANGLIGISSADADPIRCKLGRLVGVRPEPIKEAWATPNGFGSVVAVADRARTIGGGVAREPPGEARRFGRMEASSDCDVWWTLELDVEEMVEMVDTLECVGDRLS